MMTKQTAWALAHLVHELRPEWEASGVVAALKRCSDRDPFLVALAAIRATADKDARTPGVIPAAGTHWQDGVKRDPERRSFNVACPNHAGEILPCGRCANESVAAPLAKHHLTQARADLAAARARCCSHGIVRELCREGHDQPETTEET